MIDACDGSVIGAGAYARSNRAPRIASASIVGVRAREYPYAPTRSARSVSTVINTRFFGGSGSGGGDDEQPLESVTAISRLAMDARAMSLAFTMGGRSSRR